MDATITTINHSDDDHFFISWSGLVGATLTVLITTLDDSIWLVSFVGTSSLPMSARLVNAAIFLSSLLGLAILCCALAIAIEQGLATQTSLEAKELEHTLQWIAVLVCWILAAGFYMKSQLKKRRRRQQQQQENQQQLQNHTDRDMGEQGRSNYGSLPRQEEDTATQGDDTRPPATTCIHPDAQPCTILSLTTIGFLDEISYFPALIVGQIFSVWELILGTLLAGMAMLWIQSFLASQCKPLIDFLDDNVKLYMIIALFALYLTINLILEYIKGNLEEQTGSL